ncbi:MAG: helix-turn-helix transcriptional regulator, partial [Erysipelotrichales bacterium]|nr:helix-turn-helix transcriptional regulator [Erysipelotrichales bacterium]
MKKHAMLQNAETSMTDPVSICSFDYEAIEKPTRALMHQASRFWYFKKGHGKISIDEAEYELKPNTLVAVTPWKISDVVEVDDTLQLIVLVYDYQYINSTLQGLNVLEVDCAELLAKLEVSPVCYLDSIQAERMDMLMDDLKQELGVESTLRSPVHKPLGFLYVTNKLIELMVLYNRYVMAGMGDPGEDTSNQKSIMSYIYAHSSEKLTLSKLADVFYMSESTISKEIKDTTGAGFNKLLTSIRIEKATDYLLYTDMNLNEIAHSIGFVDASHLSKHFVTKTGMTPLTYRKTYAKVKRQYALTSKEAAYAIVDYLHKNYTNEYLDGEEVAGTYGLSVSEMNRSLLYYCEKNFDTLLNYIRTNKACELLTSTNLSILTVAVEVG